MKYILTIMKRRMVKLNLIEIKIRDLRFFLHFFIFFAVQEGCTEISLRLRKKIYGQGVWMFVKVGVVFV